MSDEFHEELGRRIRAARDKKLTQEGLAERVGLSRTAITNIERGRQRLLVNQLVDIARALEVDAARLLPNAQSVQGEAALEADNKVGLPTVDRWIRSLNRGV